MIIAVLTGVNAQTYNFWAGGRTTLWAGDDKGTVIIAPEVGYHLNSQFTVAASIGIHSVKYKNGHPSKGYTDVVLNPYLRYTAFKKGMLLGFIDGGVEFGLGDIEGVEIGFKPGVALALTDRVTIATQFGFIGYNDGKMIGGRGKGFGLDLSGYRSSIAFFYSF